MARPILQLQATDEELVELGRMARGTKVSVGDRFRDVIGLYINPPERALVLCCDEKSQCQALGAHAAPPSSEERLRTHPDP